MSIWCLFGHRWGRQKNIREAKISDEAAMATLFVFPLAFLFGPPKDCDRECLRCGKVKTFPFNREIGT